MKKSFIFLAVAMAIVLALIAAYMVPAESLAGSKTREDITYEIADAVIGFIYYYDYYPYYDFCYLQIMPIIDPYYNAISVDGKVIVTKEGVTPTSVKMDLRGDGPPNPWYSDPPTGKFSGGIWFESTYLPSGYEYLLGFEYSAELTVGSNGSVRLRAEGTIPIP